MLLYVLCKKDKDSDGTIQKNALVVYNKAVTEGMEQKGLN
jgi:hypothetical protein